MKKETYYQLLNQRPGWKLLVHCNCFDTVVGGYLCWHYIQTQKTQHSGNFQCTSLWGEYASPCKAWKMLTSVYNYSWTVSLGNCTLNKERNIHDGVLSCVCLFCMVLFIEQISYLYFVSLTSCLRTFILSSLFISS